MDYFYQVVSTHRPLLADLFEILLKTLQTSFLGRITQCNFTVDAQKYCCSLMPKIFSIGLYFLAYKKRGLLFKTFKRKISKL